MSTYSKHPICRNETTFDVRSEQPVRNLAIRPGTAGLPRLLGRASEDRERRAREDSTASLAFKRLLIYLSTRASSRFIEVVSSYQFCAVTNRDCLAPFVPNMSLVGRSLRNRLPRQLKASTISARIRPYEQNPLRQSTIHVRHLTGSSVVFNRKQSAIAQRLPDPEREPQRFRDFDLQDKVFVVTGGGRGLGLTLAEVLVEAGGKGASLRKSSKVLTSCSILSGSSVSTGRGIPRL